MRLHSALAAAAATQSPGTLFGVLGDGNMFFVESFVREQGGRYVAASNEAGAILMASGYAAASGDVGFATVTHGPGLANAVASLTSAARSRLPVVVFAGDTAAAARGHSQNIGQELLVAPTGAGFERVRAASAPTDMLRAFWRARAERRPVVLNVPVDIIHSEVDFATPKRAGVPTAVQAVRPDPAAMDAAVGLIATARRPIVLGGAGAMSSIGIESLRRLASTLGSPLATTLPAKGMFGIEKNDLGVFGTLSHPRAAEAIAASDCIVVAGASLTHHTGGGEGWPYLQDKRVVHCDIDPEVLGSAASTVDVSVQSDAAVFADTIVEWLGEVDYAPTDFCDVCMASDAGSPGPLPESGEVTLTSALVALNRAMPAERSVVVDGGRFSIETIQRIEIPGPRRFAFSAMGFGAVGNGVSTAIGAGCARPDSPVVAVVGDGGFMLGGLSELNTAVRYGVDLIVVVCNDSSYGAEYAKLRSRGFEGAVSMFEWPDFAEVAKALGGAGVTVRTQSDLAELSRTIEGRDRPLLIDVRLDAESVPYRH